MSFTADDVPTACRQAAALLVHHQSRSAEGINAVLQEVNDGDDGLALVMGLLNLYDMLLPELRTPAAIAMMQDFTAQVAARDISP